MLTYTLYLLVCAAQMTLERNLLDHSDDPDNPHAHIYSIFVATANLSYISYINININNIIIYSR